jgi:hypothetical protein
MPESVVSDGSRAGAVTNGAVRGEGPGSVAPLARAGSDGASGAVVRVPAHEPKATVTSTDSAIPSGLAIRRWRAGRKSSRMRFVRGIIKETSRHPFE